MSKLFYSGPPPEIIGAVKATTPATTTSASGTTLVIPKPAGVRHNDLMIAHIQLDNFLTNNIIAPSGWTQILNELGLCFVYTKRASDSEPSEYTWTVGITGRARTGVMVAVRYGVLGDVAITSGAPLICPTVMTGVMRGALFIGGVSFPRATNTESISADSPLTLAVQHVANGTAAYAIPYASALGYQSNLGPNEPVANRSFTSAGGTSGTAFTSSLILNPEG